MPGAEGLVGGGFTFHLLSAHRIPGLFSFSAALPQLNGRFVAAIAEDEVFQ